VARTPTSPTVAESPGARVHTDKPETTPLAPGDHIGRYELLEQIGAGGMGVVFRANDPQLGRAVAIKVLVGDHTEERAQRLLREAQAMAQLSHPNLVTVYDAGRDGDRVFLAMELVNGTSLRRWFDTPGRSWRQRLAGVIAAGRGLAAAHDAGIVHRDFKPENVLVDRAERMKVTDFGLARAEPTAAPTTPAAGPVDLTRTGSVLGTPAYMAAEQHAGKIADARSDQFAVAVTAWEAIWSVRPFPADEIAPLVFAIRDGAITPPPGGTGVPSRVEAVLRRALRVDPATRYPTLAAMLDALERASRPRRWPVAVVAALVVAGGGAVAVWQAGVFGGGHGDVYRDAIQIVIEYDASDSDPGPEVDKVVDEHRDELNECFDRAIPLHGPSIVRLGFEIAPDGRVRRVEIVSDDSGSPSLARCTAAAALGWEFPVGTKGSFTKPLRFGFPKTSHN
jgi:predicted Ser/Thr protein kinase